jgi:hypothetical protein
MVSWKFEAKISPLLNFQSKPTVERGRTVEVLIKIVYYICVAYREIAKFHLDSWYLITLEGVYHFHNLASSLSLSFKEIKMIELTEVKFCIVLFKTAAIAPGDGNALGSTYYSTYKR